MKNTPTTDQMDALGTFAFANGRTWKQALRHCWETGLYRDYSGTEGSNFLRQVRNEFGPSWLVRFKLPTCTCGEGNDPKLAHRDGCALAEPVIQAKAMLQPLELTNGEGAMIARLFDFLSFMVSESAPVPRHPHFNEEAEALLASYVKHSRREQMQYVSELRVSRGESPLPASLLGAN